MRIDTYDFLNAAHALMNQISEMDQAKAEYRASGAPVSVNLINGTQNIVRHFQRLTIHPRAYVDATPVAGDAEMIVSAVALGEFDEADQILGRLIWAVEEG